ncbi:MAG: universal stress protein [Pseudomonadota bacterium]
MLQINESPIVVPIDFSEACNLVLQQTVANADHYDIHLLHVLTPGLHSAYSDMGLMGVGDVDDEARLAAVRKHFDGFLKERGWEHIKSEIRVGDPGTEIADYAEELKAGMIILPSHGYHGFRRLMLGSVAERVIRLAKCSVLVLRRGDAE